MAVNTRTEYALRALLEIADMGGSSISAQSICERQQLPKKYVEHLLSALKKAGLVVSSSGSKGGYTLERPLAQISLYDVLEAVEDHTPELGCAEHKQHCMGASCRIKSILGDVAEKQRALYKTYTLDHFGPSKGKEQR